jgi:hypothetical protein
MKFLTWTEKQLIKNIMLTTLERAFSKQMAHELYMTYGEAVFRVVEGTEWYQDGKDILAENIDYIVWNLIIKAGKHMFEEQD